MPNHFEFFGKIRRAEANALRLALYAFEWHDFYTANETT